MGRAVFFKEEFTFAVIAEQRLEESRDIIAKYPDRIPRDARTDLPQMEKKKYLVPKDMSVGEFIHVLSKRLDLAPWKALFVFVKNTLPQTGPQGTFIPALHLYACLMGSIYEMYEDEDGLFYSSEKTFGSQFYPE